MIYSHIKTLQRIISNTGTKRTLTKTKYLKQEEYNNLINYIALNITNNKTISYKEEVYNTKYETKTRIKFYITDNSGSIINISHIIYLLYKKFVPYLKLNITHNYIIGNLSTVSEVYARISNYIYSINKTKIRIQVLTPFTE